ncbi:MULTISPECIES: peptidoglycan-binding protein [Prauserella salsuginis group]|uniref:Peptidoglycan hydrolase-like protein with peptidoglycan-binding domain n=2 Tax=Prauserella salsuginis group TaxID=2893672 RepID=A0A839XGY8_9PSEU|nr:MULTISPECIES: peptidoglycan-binding protein [Prauserella salsuginis group]MBB3662011.1 peptidoglycan hydrolase-like protein with peptidoglycan-binding domain [Prauserella sediminis]MCR3719710.1 Peptidoglycan-binding (PGRP) domain of peptidoglycan hydrolases-containing protein [Prauserella flava]MCR3736747.1 Peptidoglycan-binding (PGRP) domain of peptidoglycan hydrolases-containing protein [Prauserella salsuginis]
MKNLRTVTRRSMLRGTAVAGMAAAAGLLIPTSANAASTADTQKSLKGLYYYRGVVDGDLGPMTISSVKAFQSDRGLVVDGDPGPITQGELAKVVKAVQSAVGVVADGDYGSVTISAVKKFQSSKGLAVDGYAGAKTMAALGVQRKKGSGSDPDPGGSGELVVINQMDTGPKSDENCGPTAAVITLYALDRPPSGTHKQAVINMREACQIPAGTWGSDVSHLIRGLGAYDTNARKVDYASALAAAADGKPVILNVNHGVLLGGAPSYGHYVVARGTNSAGDFYVSDPGRASLGIKSYSRSRLEAAARYNRGIIVG